MTMPLRLLPPPGTAPPEKTGPPLPNRPDSRPMAANDDIPADSSQGIGRRARHLFERWTEHWRLGGRTGDDAIDAPEARSHRGASRRPFLASLTSHAGFLAQSIFQEKLAPGRFLDISAQVSAAYQRSDQLPDMQLSRRSRVDISL